MAARADLSDLSELEREFELELSDETELEASDQELSDQELSDQEFEDTLQGEANTDDREFEEELEGMDPEASSYGERFAALASREFESEFELDQAVGEVLSEIEQEHFFGPLKRSWRNLKKGGFGALLTKGLKFAAGRIPAFQALKGITSLARNGLKGNLMSLVKAGIGTAFPGAGLALDALKGLGGNSEVQEDHREAWDNVAEIAREAFEHLASNLTENANQPLEANRLASEAFKAGLRKVTARARPNALGQATRGPGPATRRGGLRRRIRLHRGDVLIIRCD